MKKLETTIGVVVVAVLGIALLSQRPKATASQEPEKRAVQRAQQQKLQSGGDGDWSAVVEWMQRVCPNQIKFLQDNGMEKPAARRVKQLMTEQFRQIKNVADPQLHQVLEMKASVQDNIFGTLLQYRDAKARGNSLAAAKAQRDLEQCVSDLAKCEVAIRQARIIQLNREIDELTIPQKRAQWIARMTKQQMNQADAPPGRGGNTEIFASPDRNNEKGK